MAAVYLAALILSIINRLSEFASSLGWKKGMVRYGFALLIVTWCGFAIFYLALHYSFYLAHLPFPLVIKANQIVGLLLELALVPYNMTSAIAFYLTFTAAIFTALYSVRLLALTFLGRPLLPFTTGVASDNHQHQHYSRPVILIGLAIVSSVFGFLAQDWQLGDSALAHSQPTFQIQNIPLMTLLIASMAIPFYSSRLSTTNYHFLSLQSLHLLPAWNNFNGQLIGGGMSLALMVGRYWDRGLIEIMGPLGLERLFHFLTFNLELLATGFLPHYALLLLSLSWLTFILSTLLVLVPYLPEFKVVIYFYRTYSRGTGWFLPLAIAFITIGSRCRSPFFHLNPTIAGVDS